MKKIKKIFSAQNEWKASRQTDRLIAIVLRICLLVQIKRNSSITTPSISGKIRVMLVVSQNPITNQILHKMLLNLINWSLCSFVPVRQFRGAFWLLFSFCSFHSLRKRWRFVNKFIRCFQQNPNLMAPYKIWSNEIKVNAS